MSEASKVVAAAALVYPAGATWVLVKGYHDSGTVEAVYGPFTRAQIDWIMEIAEGGIHNLTALEIQQWPDRFG